MSFDWPWFSSRQQLQQHEGSIDLRASSVVGLTLTPYRGWPPTLACQVSCGRSWSPGQGHEEERNGGPGQGPARCDLGRRQQQQQQLLQQHHSADYHHRGIQLSSCDGLDKSPTSAQVPEKRQRLLERRRKRNLDLSREFYRLKLALPNIPANTKLSRLDTLEQAVRYLRYLNMRCFQHVGDGGIPQIEVVGVTKAPAVRQTHQG